MADKYFYRDSVTTKVRYTRGRFEGWTEPSGLLNAPYAIFRTAKTVIYVPQYSLMAETRQRLPQPGQPSELEKRFQEGIKEAEDFAARFLAEHGEAGNAEYFGQPIKHVCVAVLSILILYNCWNIRDSHNQDMYARNIMQYNEVVVQFFDFRFGSTQFATLLAGAQAKLLRYAPGDLAGGLTAEFNGEQCPGCAGIVRDYCDACAFGRTRHILV